MKSFSLTCVCHVVILGTSCFNGTIFPLIFLTAVFTSWLMQSTGDVATTGMMLLHRWAVGTLSQSGHFREHCLGWCFQCHTTAVWEGLSVRQMRWIPASSLATKSVWNWECVCCGGPTMCCKVIPHQKGAERFYWPFSAAAMPAAGGEIKKNKVRTKRES